MSEKNGNVELYYYQRVKKILHNERVHNMNKNITVKIISAAMAAAMAVSAGSVCVSAANNTASVSESAKESAMRSYLAKVKRRITVPAELTEFNYSVDNIYKTDCYTFKWTTPDGAKEHKELTVVIVGDIIISYNLQNYSSDNVYKQSLAKLSDEKLISKAKEHVKKLDPNIYTHLSYTISNINLFGENAVIELARLENGIKVSENGGSITINKDTGELVSFSLSYWDTDSFPSNSTAKSLSEVQNIIKDKTTLTPVYSIQHDWDKDEDKAVLLYRPDFSDNIDALTGKSSTFISDMNKDEGTSYYPFGFSYYDDMPCEEDTVEAADMASNDYGGVTFTEAELKEINADKNLLSKDKVTEMLRKDTYIALSPEYKLTDSSMSKIDDDYFYSLVYEAKTDTDSRNSVDVYLNAKTGAVESFSKYDSQNDLDSSKPYPVAQNNKIAEKAAAHFYPDIFSQYKPSALNTVPSESYTYNNRTTYETSRLFVFDRYVNGVVVEGESICVEVTNRGEVKRCRYEYTDIKFPSVPKFDKEKAFTKLFSRQPPELVYQCYIAKDGKIKSYLTYTFDSYTLDSSYKIVSSRGYELYKSEKQNTNYTDISGIKQEEAIRTMARYGITLKSENGKFDPNGTVKYSEMLNLISSVTKQYVYYDYAVEDDSSISNTPVTNSLTARAFVETIGGAEFAKLSGIYKSPFTDVKSDNEYIGYIAIAKAMGFAKGTNGKFYPDHMLTRAEAMQLVYDYVKSLQ